MTFWLQGSLLLGGLVAGLATTILIAVVAQNRRLGEDSVIGVFFAAAFALGIVLISRVPGYTGSLQQFLFGSITGINNDDVTMVALTTGIVVLVTLLFHKEFVTVGLDRDMAHAQRIPVLGMDLLLYVLVTVVVVISVQVIGNVLVLALLITPAAAARMLTDRIAVMMVLSPVIGALAALVGLYLSWSIDLPAGGTIVLVATAFFGLASLVRWLRSLRTATRPELVTADTQ
mgnify:CR=1 FL=1